MPKKEPTAPPLYPDLQELTPADEPAQTDGGMAFRLKHITDIRRKLEDESESRTRLRRRYKSLYNTAMYLNASSGIISSCASVATVISLSTGIGVVIALPVGTVALATGMLSVISTGFGKIIMKKLEKHERIKMLAHSKLSSISALISQALKDGRISHEEYDIILAEEESYRDTKAYLQSKVKTVLNKNYMNVEQKIDEAEKKGIEKGKTMVMTSIATLQRDPLSTPQP